MKLILTDDEGVVLDSWDTADGDFGVFEALADEIAPNVTAAKIRAVLTTMYDEEE